MARMNKKALRHLRKICARSTNPKKCLRNLKRLDHRAQPVFAQTTKIRSCKPSDKGVKQWRRRMASLVRASQYTTSDGRAEMYSAWETDLLKAMQRRCGRRFTAHLRY